MPMTGEDRRKEIVKQIQEGRYPIPAKKLAADYHVSRQVIVQDIALIRASGYDIISTNRGYIPVSYTHLDVYKRQISFSSFFMVHLQQRFVKSMLRRCLRSL